MKLSQAILHEELPVFDKKFKEAVKSQVPLLDRIMRFIVNRKGKQLRPMFVMLSAKLCGQVTESTYRAFLVELLHTASLCTMMWWMNRSKRSFFHLRALENQDFGTGRNYLFARVYCFPSTIMIFVFCRLCLMRFAR